MENLDLLIKITKMTFHETHYAINQTSDGMLTVENLRGGNTNSEGSVNSLKRFKSSNTYVNNPTVFNVLNNLRMFCSLLYSFVL